jgi:5-formyltetrahydrofolate cyclo-ligase
MCPMTGYAGGPAREAKRTLRARFRAERRERCADRDREADAAWIAEAGMQVVTGEGVRPGEWVSIYESTPVEPPTHALVAALRAHGIRVMVPVTLPDLDLDWVEAGSSGAPLGKDAIARARVVFVPALSLDPSGVRMGQGGGCYDRVLPRAPGARAVALVHPWEVRAEALPREEHDTPIGEVIAAGEPVRSLGGAGHQL